MCLAHPQQTPAPHANRMQSEHNAREQQQQSHTQPKRAFHRLSSEMSARFAGELFRFGFHIEKRFHFRIQNSSSKA